VRVGGLSYAEGSEIKLGKGGGVLGTKWEKGKETYLRNYSHFGVSSRLF
jgi:hypothetical protein